jgi:DNA-binding NarL/FixJ family response regulator
MHMRLLFAVPDRTTQNVLHTLLDSALCLNPLDVAYESVHSKAELLPRIDAGLDDIVLLDWQIAESETPTLVREMLQRNPNLRVVALLPESQRQYRQHVWNAGACNGIPKEYMDQEWLSTVLCLMHRAMEREQRLIRSSL